MDNLLIITPVKDSIEIALKAVNRVCNAKQDYRYLVYNDCSLPENRNILEQNQKLGFELVNIEDLVKTPSPNYRFTLIDSRKKAIESNAGLLIIESDVFIQPETIQQLIELNNKENHCGLIAAVTVDESGIINFPYDHVNKNSRGIIETKHRVSFCCTLLTNELLRCLSFEELPVNKDWYDVYISKESRRLGFINIISTDLTVLHLPHSSRPWKKLKYSNPVKYYLRKYFKKLDRI